MAGEIQLNSTTMATESSGSITAELDTIRPNTTNGSLTLQGDSSDSGVTGLTIDSSGVVNTSTAKVTNIQATSGQSLTIKDEDGNAAITIGTDNTAASYLSLNFGSYHGGAGSGALSANTLDDYEEGEVQYPLTLGSTTNTASFLHSSCRYTKIGNIVNCQYAFDTGSSGTLSGTGQVKINLPFTSFDSVTTNAPRVFWKTTTYEVSSYNQRTLYLLEGTSELLLYNDSMSGAVSVAATTDHLIIRFNITYQI